MLLLIRLLLQPLLEMLFLQQQDGAATGTETGNEETSSTYLGTAPSTDADRNAFGTYTGDPSIEEAGSLVRSLQ